MIILLTITDDNHKIIVPTILRSILSPAIDYLYLIHRSQRRVRRMVIVALRRRVQVMKSLGGRHPIEQRIYHRNEIVELYPFEIEISAQNFHQRLVLYSPRRQQVQI